MEFGSNTNVFIRTCRVFRMAIFVRTIIWRHMVAACGVYNLVNNGSVDGLLPDGTFHHTLQWRHNERDGVSSNRRLDCLLSRLCRCKSKETSKLRVTGLCEGNSPVTGEFPAQMASNAENVSIWWRRHHVHCLLVINYFHGKCSMYQWLKSVWLIAFQIAATTHSGQWVKPPINGNARTMMNTELRLTKTSPVWIHNSE